MSKSLRPRWVNNRTLVALLHDLLAASLAWYGAFWIRFNLAIPADLMAIFWHTVVWVVPLQGAVFVLFRLYRGLWRYVSLPDLQRILLAVGTAAALIPIVLLMFRTSTTVSRSTIVLDPLLLAGAMCGSRLGYRAWGEHRAYGVFHKSGKPVLIVGAGAVAINLVKELSRRQEWRAVGIVDDDPEKTGKSLQGVQVVGGISSIGDWADRLSAKHAIIAMPTASHIERRRAVDACTSAGLNVLTVPAVGDLISGKITLSEIRRVDVKDLLGRETVVLDIAGLTALLNDRVVLVTGAGGSIGSELCRQITTYQPSHLVLFELNEFALFTILEEFRLRWPELPTTAVIGDVKNSERVAQVFSEFRPHIVFHAAAYKHVPLMEEQNAWEAVQNNVHGTFVLAEAAIEHAVERFVLISTDKAVNPVNVMGATKRLAEMVCQGLQDQDATKFSMVRFGNVLGSNGSVIPKFQDQIARGGPVTVTHPDVVRYFMSIPEASQLVLQAGAMGTGGEIFVMDMGEPVKIIDLARDMIRLSGLTENDIHIEFCGLRPGEKLFEELLADDEHTLATPHPKLRISQARPVERAWLEPLERWLRGEPVGDHYVRAELRRLVPEYSGGQGSNLRAVPARRRSASAS